MNYLKKLLVGALVVCPLCVTTVRAETENPTMEKRSMLGTGETGDRARLNDRLNSAQTVFNKLLRGSDGNIPASILKYSKCVAVFPDVLKAAFIGGAEYGKGVASCRTASGTWSEPAFLSIGAASVGWQIGANSTDLVLFFVGEKAKNSLLSNKFTLGADVEVTAGIVGKGAEANIDVNKELNQVYSYANSEGIFAGLAIKGAVLSPDASANAMAYGANTMPSHILINPTGVNASTSEKGFIGVLP